MNCLDNPYLRCYFSFCSTSPTHVCRNVDRVQNRAKVTGRVVPQELLKTTMNVVPVSVRRLAPFADYCVEMHNPESGNVTIVTSNETFETFQDRWQQVCPDEYTS